MSELRHRRLRGPDVLRGLVMVIMALDHVRDYVSPTPFSPEAMDDPPLGLFLTRWITHFCAPIFVFLAGTSAFLYGSRGGGEGRPRSEVSRFLFVRGLWLVFLELTVVHAGWTLSPSPTGIVVIFQVIWALGVSMIALSGLIWLPRGALVAIGAAMVLGHGWLSDLAIEERVVNGDYTRFDTEQILWTFVHVQQFFVYEGTFVFMAYPLIPWIGVMALGYAFGPLLLADPRTRDRRLLAIGAIAIVAFVALRLIGWGDPTPYEPAGNATQSFIAFLNTAKYPPSLAFLLMTLGPALLLLPAAERTTGRVSDACATIGRVPLFYYLLHLPLIHLFGMAFFRLRWGEWHSFLRSAFTGGGPPDGYVYELGWTYLVWGLVVALLYPLCRWYAGVKARSRSRLLSYL